MPHIEKPKENWKITDIIDNKYCPYLYFPANYHGCSHPLRKGQDLNEEDVCKKDKCPIAFQLDTRDQQIAALLGLLNRLMSIADLEADCSECPNSGKRPVDHGCGLEICLTVIKNEIEKVLNS